MSYFLWAVAAAVIWGVVPIFEKIGLAKVNSVAALFYRCAGVAVGLFVLAIFFVKPGVIKSADIKSAALLMASGFLASFVGQICFYNALKTGEVSKVVPIAGAYPLLSFVLGLIALGETASAAKVVGCLLIMAGIWLLK